jgi:hypothetical protein
MTSLFYNPISWVSNITHCTSCLKRGATWLMANGDSAQSSVIFPWNHIQFPLSPIESYSIPLNPVKFELNNQKRTYYIYICIYIAKPLFWYGSGYPTGRLWPPRGLSTQVMQWLPGMSSFRRNQEIWWKSRVFVGFGGGSELKNNPQFEWLGVQKRRNKEWRLWRFWCWRCADVTDICLFVSVITATMGYLLRQYSGNLDRDTKILHTTYQAECVVC